MKQTTIELFKWLGSFAYDPEKGGPAAKSGIGLMGATTICVSALWIVFRAPYVQGYMNIVVEVLLTVGATTGLTYAATKFSQRNDKTTTKDDVVPPP